MRPRAGARPDRPRQGARDGRTASSPCAARSRSRWISPRDRLGERQRVSASPASAANVPERVYTNADLEQFVDTTDEWIVERTGIRERRFAEQDEALTDIALPAAGKRSRGRASRARTSIVLICATVTPDMMFPTSSAILADRSGAADAAAYDLLAGCTGFMYAIAQAYGMLASGLSRRALVVGGDVLSKILDWSDRSTLVLFGDGAGAVVLERVDAGGFLGFELGADGGGRRAPLASGQRLAPLRRPRLVREDERPRGLQVRDPRAGLVGREAPRRVRQDGRRRRRLRPAPGEPAHHRPCGREARASRRRRSS